MPSVSTANRDAIRWLFTAWTILRAVGPSASSPLRQAWSAATGSRACAVSSYVLRIASTDFGVFKFASSCADAAMDSGSFGTRFQCWVAVSPGGLPPAAAISRADWTLFRARPRSGGPSLLCSLPLGRALRRNHHEHVVTGQTLMRVFKPRSSFFVSHSWGDGTGEFIARLKAHVEQQTLANVWVDMEGLNQ